MDAAADRRLGEGHTTSFSIGDGEGNVVCVTQSLGSLFGSGVVVPGTGVCLNNFLYWADVNPKSPNRRSPAADAGLRRAPIVTQDGVPVLALGTPGSYGILQTQTQALVQYVDYAMPLQEAIEAPRARLRTAVPCCRRARHSDVQAELASAATTSERSRLDDEGGWHAGRRDRSQDRCQDRRLRPAPRRLRGAGLGVYAVRTASDCARSD